MASIQRLPFELLDSIFGQTSISPPHIGLSQHLYTWSSRNAYRRIEIQSPVQELLGAMITLGGLVREVIVKPVVKNRREDQDAFFLLFQKLNQVERIFIMREGLDFILSSRVVRAISDTATHLTLASPDSTISWNSLEHLHSASSLRSLEITTPMLYTAGRSTGMFTPSSCQIESLRITSEPNTRDFSSFFDSFINLKHLDIRSSSGDWNKTFDAIGKCKNSIESLRFWTTSHKHHDIDFCLVGFTRLKVLEFWPSTHLEITLQFFLNLTALPIEELIIRGSGGSLDHLIEFVQWKQESLKVIRIGHRFFRDEAEAMSLEHVCLANGVELTGSVREWLRNE